MNVRKSSTLLVIFLSLVLIFSLAALLTPAYGQTSPQNPKNSELLREPHKTI